MTVYFLLLSCSYSTSFQCTCTANLLEASEWWFQMSMVSWAGSQSCPISLAGWQWVTLPPQSGTGATSCCHPSLAVPPEPRLRAARSSCVALGFSFRVLGIVHGYPAGCWALSWGWGKAPCASNSWEIKISQQVKHSAPLGSCLPSHWSSAAMWIYEGFIF